MIKKENKEHGFLCGCCGGNNRIFWGILFILLGAWFIAKDLGYITLNLSFWPVFFVIVGFWLLFKRNKNIC